MNQRIKVAAGIIALIVAAIAIGWAYFALSPGAWDDFLSQMSGDSGGSRPDSQPIIRQPSRTTGQLLVSGTIEVEEVTVAARLGGRIMALLASEGDRVEQGDVLLRLDQEILLAQRDGLLASVAQAEAAVEAAQAQLDQARAGATEADIAAAEAAILAAEGSVAAAKAAKTQAEVNAQSAQTVKEAESSVALAEANLAQADGAVDAAEADLARAQAEYQRLIAGARPEEIALYEAQLAQAEAAYLGPRTAHDQLVAFGVTGVEEELARYQMWAAAAARDAAQAQLDLAKADPTAEEIAIAEAVVSGARAQVSIAEGGQDAATANLAQAQAGPETSEDQVAQAEAGVAVAEAHVRVAEGQLAQAKATLDRLLAGATEEEIAVLEAQVSQAEAALTSAEASVKALDIEIGRSDLIAPTGGVVLERLVHQGELAAPGAPLFTLADLDEVTLTVYVPEAELGKVFIGQAVEVQVDAYDHVFPGEVAAIASEAEFTPKNIQTQEERVHMVFGVKVHLDNADHLLKPGMPADALFAET